jgi:DNA polymerase III alpha subunit
MKEFSSYSFNKAHSASYAHMAYQAVYLKVHHPVVYLRHLCSMPSLRIKDL